jgi:sugar O-acyltransferase (sialic acid O-acetyltransferase NeuD family)
MADILFIEGSDMKRLIIIGAGGFGREVLSWAIDIEPTQQDWRLYGFLDENSTALKNYSLPYAIFGSPSTYDPTENDVFVCAIGDPKKKLSICKKLKDRGAKFTNLVHNSAIIGNGNKIGLGCILCPRSTITTNVVLGDFITINVNSGIGHDAVINDGVTISAQCDITGNTFLGEGVFIGSNAVILPSVKVGSYAVVGAGSMVLRKVDPGTTVMGNPAKRITGF